MRKLVVFAVLCLTLISAGRGTNLEAINPEDLSLKAGPTEPGEELSLLWLEALVYPKVLREDKLISLGVRLTSPVEEIVATFDFSADEVSLDSYDGMSWSGVYKIAEEISPGLHMVRYNIVGAKGSIQRTLDFFVETAAVSTGEGWRISLGETPDLRTWELTVSSTCAALVEGASRILYAGERVTGIAKVPWYKVMLEDGEEGWISSAVVEEPVEEYYALGYKAYLAGSYETAVKHYKNTTAIDPGFIKGHFWTAKSYYRMGNVDAAYASLLKAIELDARDMDAKIFAGTLANDYFQIAHASFNEQRFHEAIALYKKILQLKDNSVRSWIELGQSYEQLGFASEARSAWREALKADPENKEVYALLKLPPDTALLARVEEKATIVAKHENLTEIAEELPPSLADDSLLIVKSKTTRKGTNIEAALKSVIALTKSLGTPVLEKGWNIKKQGDKFLVRYLCEQGAGALEAFEWLVDIDSRRVSANNDNAELLMNRW